MIINYRGWGIKPTPFDYLVITQWDNVFTHAAIFDEAVRVIDDQLEMVDGYNVSRYN